MAEENLLTSSRTDAEVFCYGAKHLEKGRIDSSDNGTSVAIVDSDNNKLKFFAIVED